MVKTRKNVVTGPRTTIAISQSLYERIVKDAKYGESLNEILSRIVSVYENERDEQGNKK